MSAPPLRAVKLGRWNMQSEGFAIHSLITGLKSKRSGRRPRRVPADRLRSALSPSFYGMASLSPLRGWIRGDASWMVRCPLMGNSPV